MEFWASPEPTIARLGAGAWRDQLAETGHDARLEDIELLAGLGVAAVRYPVLWERDDVAWARPRLELLRARGVAPIVTLLHHGSGPAHTSLIDPEFPTRFAGYAEAVARAFPWVERWTPINEPLTTARFSTLYGHWYPNLRDETAFGRAVVNQALAIQLAMERIREVNPGARLMITEDLQGFTAGDPSEESDVEFLRERAYLAIELVMGRVRKGHALWTYLCGRCEVPGRLLGELAARAITPQAIGWNWYPYSERFRFRAGGKTVDVGAVHVDGCAISPRPLLRAAHARLGLPAALSEVHVHAGEDERVRWLLQRHDDVRALANEGVPIHALGAWAAFGMVDWDSLLRERAGIAEDGVFTFAPAGAAPRETAVARALRALVRNECLPLPEAPGWWEREDRIRRLDELAAAV